MSKFISNMPEELKNKCRKVIHSATAASGAAGAIPIPVSDAIPISTAQVGMIIALGKIFDMELSEATSKSIISVTLTNRVGHRLFTTILKTLPGTKIVGSLVAAATAAAITEALGWSVANDFYNVKQGKKPDEALENITQILDGVDISGDRKQGGEPLASPAKSAKRGLFAAKNK